MKARLTLVAFLFRYGPETPEYARRNSILRYVMQLAMGLKGTF